MKHIGYGAYTMGYGAYKMGYGDGCDPSKASTCDVSGVCYDDKGCPPPSISTAAEAKAYWNDLEKKFGPKGPGVMAAYLKYEDLAEKENKAGGSGSKKKYLLLIAPVIALVLLAFFLKGK